MKILTFTSLFPNSLQPDYAGFVLQRVSHLARRRGNHVEVVAPLPYIPGFLKRTTKGRIASIPSVETIAGSRVRHPRYLLLPKISMPLHALLMYSGCQAVVRALHREHRFDCIDAHYVFPDGVAAVLMGRSLQIPVCLTARGSDIHTFSRFFAIRPQIRWALRHADGVAAVSSSLAQIMLQLSPSLPPPVEIGNGVDVTRFFLEDRALARKIIGADQDAKLIVSVAALRHVKGCDLLVRAASMLQASTPGCKILFVGDGPELSSLRRLAVELNCADVCTFVGQVSQENLRHYYNAADVSCLPSRNEGCPNVVLESLACGTPVIATRVGAVPEILADVETGIVVDLTPESIHQALRFALGRPWNRATIASKAKLRSWEQVAQQAEEFLLHAIRKAPRNHEVTVYEDCNSFEINR